MVAAGVRRLVHLGALGVEDDPRRCNYARSKARAELAVRESGLDWTILRPSLSSVSAMGSSTSSPPCSRPRACRAGAGRREEPLPADPRRRRRPRRAPLAERPETIGEVFDLGGPRTWTYRQITGEVARAVGRRRVIVPMPVALIRLVAGVWTSSPRQVLPGRDRPAAAACPGQRRSPGGDPSCIRLHAARLEGELRYLRSQPEGPGERGDVLLGRRTADGPAPAKHASRSPGSPPQSSSRWAPPGSSRRSTTCEVAPERPGSRSRRRTVADGPRRSCRRSGRSRRRRRALVRTAGRRWPPSSAATSDPGRGDRGRVGAAGRHRSRRRYPRGRSRADPVLTSPTRHPLSGGHDARYDELVAGIDADGPAPAWERLTAGSAGGRATDHLLAHDQLVGEAIQLGGEGKYQKAITTDREGLGRARRGAHSATAWRRQSTWRTLDQWIERNAAYDEALHDLYDALRRSAGKVTNTVRDADARERAAKDQLPPDARALVVILGEVAQGGLNRP